MNVRFPCTACEAPVRADLPGPDTARCPACDHVNALAGAPQAPAISHCAACGNAEVYRKKDFPHALGMGILIAACLGSTLTYWLYDKYWTWAILLGSAAFDGILYLLVKDVVECYRCGAEHRGMGEEAARHAPFELTVHEKYRQERIRREELEAKK